MITASGNSNMSTTAPQVANEPAQGTSATTSSTASVLTLPDISSLDEAMLMANINSFTESA